MLIDCVEKIVKIEQNRENRHDTVIGKINFACSHCLKLCVIPKQRGDWLVMIRVGTKARDSPNLCGCPKRLMPGVVDTTHPAAFLMILLRGAWVWPCLEKPLIITVEP